jgi:hypothetical protein
MNGLFQGLGGLDPSKLNPQAIAEISDLMRTLSPDQIMKMQTLMHNAMGGFDVNNEMAEFEKSLPASFREKMARIAYVAHGIEVPPQSDATLSTASNVTSTGPTPLAESEKPANENEARLVILRSVAAGMMSPEEAIRVLF